MLKCVTIQSHECLLRSKIFLVQLGLVPGKRYIGLQPLKKTPNNMYLRRGVILNFCIIVHF